MRVLFTSVPSSGHLHPLLPLAQALAAAGHEVAVASGGDAVAVVAETGLVFVEAGRREPEIVAEAIARMPDATPAERGIAMFATIAAPALVDDLLPQLDRLAPDVVIHEEGEWGGPVVAAMAGVPSAAHGWGSPLWTEHELRTIDVATAPLWRHHGVEPASPGGLFDHLYLDACPPVLQAQNAERVARRQTLRFRPFDSGHELPSWFDALDGRPLVYVTLGTVPAFNTAPETLAAVKEALAAEAVDVVITVGKNNDPRELGPLPSNVRAERYLPQAKVLARCTVAITHGGAGSTIAALSLGLPVLVLPRGAPSQHRLAARCAETGAGLALDPDDVTASTVHDAVQALLANTAFRVSAERVRASIDAQPDETTIVPRLETLARAGAS
jgi:UDP:flavonoid glycosyltransferase YjiC (YdhE family)